ncbi:MAG: class I SAM-dependent methyltransferase [Gemmatimonadaceae bacterium]
MLKYPLQLLGMSEGVFTRIHDRNFWEAGESRSGPGSTLGETASIRAQLPGLLRELGVTSLLDAPCGDFNWMGQTALDLDLYVGGDIVRSVVDRNNAAFATSRRRFVHLDVIRDDLPKADAIFCRDCLVHFSDRDVRKALRNFSRSGAKYLITTTYPGRGRSINIVTGEWQPLDLQDAPFFLPPPSHMVSENHLERDGADSRKSLGIWKISDISASEGRTVRESPADP